MTSFEDLPADLFGEEDASPATDGGTAVQDGERRAEAPARTPAAAPSRRTSGSPDRDPGPAAEAASHEGRGRERDAANAPGPAGAPPTGSESSGDPALEVVQQLFPGRLISLDPYDAEGGAEGDAEPDAGETESDEAGAAEA